MIYMEGMKKKITRRLCVKRTTINSVNNLFIVHFSSIHFIYRQNIESILVCFSYCSFLLQQSTVNDALTPIDTGYCYFLQKVLKKKKETDLTSGGNAG